jgi:hypothetical protein
MKISYAITVCNELDEIKRLVPFLHKRKRPEDEICVLLDKPKVSQSLLDAFEHLNSTLKNSGKGSLDEPTRKKVDDVIAKLKEAEEEVKSHRDAINDFTGLLASGKVTNTHKNMKYEDIKATVQRYNESLKLQNKLETKILRVVATLGFRAFENA